jgi:hypothetical protein
MLAELLIGLQRRQGPVLVGFPDQLHADYTLDKHLKR